jgi:multidrug efflux pump subunit AcrA (membrane-fusion protein)
MNRARLTLVVIVLLAIVAGVPTVRAAWSQLQPPASSVPTTRVKRGQVDTNVYANGELRTRKSSLLFAPPTGGQMRLLTVETTGAPVKAGEVVMSFDPSDQENTLEEQEALLRESDVEIEKDKADSTAQAAQDEVDLLTAQFDVRKAELDVSANELRSAIDARKNELTLEEKKRHLAELQDDIKSHTKTNDAAMAVSLEKRNKAKLAMEAAQRLIAQMTVRAPFDGFVAVRPNDEGLQISFGIASPEYRAGDMVSSGRQVAEVLDVAQMELVARVAETDRNRLAPGQRADVRIDHEPTILRAAHVVNVGGVRMALGFGRADGPVRMIDVALGLDQPLLTARPGLSAKIVVNSDPLKNVLYLPRQAVFDQEGKSTVFVKSGGGFERRAVKISARTDTLVVVEDLKEGDEVALADPEQQPGKPRGAGPTGSAGSPTRLVAR